MINMLYRLDSDTRRVHEVHVLLKETPITHWKNYLYTTWPCPFSCWQGRPGLMQQQRPFQRTWQNYKHRKTAGFSEYYQSNILIKHINALCPSTLTWSTLTKSPMHFVIFHSESLVNVSENYMIIRIHWIIVLFYFLCLFKVRRHNMCQSIKWSNCSVSWENMWSSGSRTIHAKEQWSVRARLTRRLESFKVQGRKPLL